jgi:tetratricopeptide (TPR) repeat protein
MLVRILDNLAGLALRAGHRDEAGENLRRALDIAERRLGQEHPLYGAVLAKYAEYLKQCGEKTRAKALQAKSNQILRNSNQRNGIGAVIDVSALQHK